MRCEDSGGPTNTTRPRCREVGPPVKDNDVRELPRALRLYLLAVYAACAILVVGQVALTFGGDIARADSGIVLWPALLFALLAYLGERTSLQVSAAVDQSLATPVHIAAILLLPAPVPLLITLAAVVASQAMQGDRERYKRFFNICHPTLAVGVSTLALSLFVAPTAALGAVGGSLTDHGVAPILYVAALLATYYALDVGTLLGVLALLEGRPLLEVWRTVYRRNALPELATSAIGVLAAVAWRHNPVLLIPVILPVLALRAAFGAIAAAEGARGVAREAQARAEEALRVRDDFMNAASHDLRTPLTGVMGRSELLQMRLDSGRALDEAWFHTQLDLLRQSAVRMAAVVEEITDAAQLQMGRTLALKRERIDLGEMARSVATMVAAASTWNNAAPVEVEAPADVVVEGDRRRLERVVQNVVGNAIKYSPSGAPVRVRVEERVENGERWATITVRDRGVGIPADELPRLFTRYYRASTSKGIAGTGIGLAGSRTIVEQHGGRIAIESAVGEGSTVTVALPHTPRSPAPAALPSE